MVVDDKHSHSSVMLTRQPSSHFKMRTSSRNPFHNMLLGLSYTAFLLTVSSVDHPMVSVVTGALEEEGRRGRVVSKAGVSGTTAASKRSPRGTIMKAIVDDDNGDHEDVVSGGGGSASRFQKKWNFSGKGVEEEGKDAEDLLKMLEEDGNWAAVTGNDGRMKNEMLVEDVGDNAGGKFAVKEESSSPESAGVVMMDDGEGLVAVEQFQEEDHSKEAKKNTDHLGIGNNGSLDERAIAGAGKETESIMSKSTTGVVKDGELLVVRNDNDYHDDDHQQSKNVDSAGNPSDIIAPAMETRQLTEEAATFTVHQGLDKCPTGYEVPQEECDAAIRGLFSGLSLTPGLSVKDWDFTPCGCFLWNNHNVDFDTGTTECIGSVNGKTICKDVLPNLALTGVASQSSDYTNESYPDGRGADLAIDGNSNGGPSFVTHTKWGANNWWKVNLQGLYLIRRVVIWNRTDCCSSRLSNAVLEILDQGENVISSYNVGDATDKEKFVFDMDIYGVSWVRVRSSSDEPLSLAEVHVFGKEYKLAYGSIVFGEGSSATMTAHGQDFWGTEDSGYFYGDYDSGQSLSFKNNFEVQLYTESGLTVDDGHRWAKFGLMIRNSLDPKGKHFSVYLSRSEGVHAFYRNEYGSNTIHPAGGNWGVRGGGWLKILKTGNVFKAYYGTDTASFELLGQATLDLDGDLEVGVALTSHEFNKETSITYSDFSVTVHRSVAGVSSNVVTSHLANANFLDTNIDTSDWSDHPRADVVAPATAYIDVDLGKQMEIDAVTIWHFWPDGRQYKNQKLEVSKTGAFGGEQIEIYNVALGPVETSSGNTITLSSSVVGRYIRHTCGGSTKNNSVHFIGLKADGVEVHRSVAGVSSGVDTSTLANLNFLDTNHIKPYDSVEKNYPTKPGRNPAATAYIDVDLGKQMGIDAVTIWHYWPDGRQYKNQKLEVSKTGAFGGEQIEIYNVALGPVETSSGNTITLSSSVVGRYIRHTCGGSTKNKGVHFLGLKVDGGCIPNSGLARNSHHGETCECFNGFTRQDSDGLWWCEAVDSLENVPKLKINMVQDASFEGSYGSNPSDGTFNQDFSGGVIAGPEENAITMFGNAWKAYKLPNPVKISKSTMLKFNFESYEEAEGNAICLDEDKNEDTYGGLRKRCFAIMMSNSMNQVDKWNNVEKVESSPEGTYEVRLGRLSNDQDITVKYLAFIQDNDSPPSRGGKSKFSNIEIYDDETPNTLKSLEWSLDGNSSVDVSRHDGPVSISKDGQTAVYGSGGNVHLIRKGDNTTVVA